MSSQGVKAMQFIQDQIEAGIKPIANSNFATISFINRTYAVFPQGSWLPGELQADLKDQILLRK